MGKAGAVEQSSLARGLHRRVRAAQSALTAELGEHLPVITLSPSPLGRAVVGSPPLLLDVTAPAPAHSRSSSRAPDTSCCWGQRASASPSARQGVFLDLYHSGFQSSQV